jgi:hypothetical protein
VAIRNTEQYRPITEAETDADAAFSVRQMVRGAANLNNWHDYVGNYPLVLESWIANGSSVTDVVSPNASTDDTMVLFLGKHYVPRSYYRVRFYLQARVYTGSDVTQWTIHAATSLYTGPDAPVDTGYLKDDTTTTVEVSGSTWEIWTDTVETPVRLRSGDGCLYFYASAANGDASTRSTVLSLTIQPSY